jgi:AmmeMemoRadiSam system protein B
MATDIRPAAVAGSWYPESADRLAREVDAYIGCAQVDERDAPIAIVAPHAGLKYSGPVAAFAYRAVQHGHYDAAVLVGPSHFIGFSGVSIWPRGAWQTPFGAVQVAEDLARAIAAVSGEVIEHPPAHGREHSVEMQLPFLAHLLPGVPIVPMVMGYQDRETAFALGDALATAIGNRTAAKGRALVNRVLLVASSDLSHYEDAPTAETMDAVVLREVEQLDPEGLMQVLEREPHHACGGGPIVAVLHAARRLGATRARVLKYGDSGDVSGDKSSVVGYMAAAIW